MPLTSEDWDLCGGQYCLGCGAEVVRLIDGKCPQCYQALTAIREAKFADRVERRYVMRRIQEGTISRRDLRDGHY